MNIINKKNSLVRIMKYIKPHWHLILISTLAGVIKLSLPLLLPKTVKYFTDVVFISPATDAEKMDIIIKCCISLSLLYIFLYIPACYFRNTGAAEAANRVMHKMRCEVYDHLQKMSASFHVKNKSGDLITRINNDVEQVFNFIWNIATNVWIDFIMIIIYLYFMLTTNIVLTFIAAAALPVSVAATRKLREKINKYSKKVQGSLSSISGYMQERMSGFATIKLFGLEEHESEKFTSHSNSIYHGTLRTQQLFALCDGITSASMEIISTAVVCAAASCIVRVKMSVGDLICFYLYLGYFVTPIRRFSDLTVNYSKSLAGIERVFEMLDTPVDICEAQQPVDLLHTVPLGGAQSIEFRHVYFKYDLSQKDYTLSDINLNIKSGEHIAIVGSSGCGKTTLVNLLTRFYDVTEGSILINGHNIKDYSLKSLYQNFGMVFQEVSLFSETIAENIRYGNLNAATEEIENAAKAANAHSFIISLPEKYDTLLGERGVGLSGGQKQRIAIARVFLKNPQILILDEATSALDSESETLIQQSLDKLTEGRTSVIIAHRLSTVLNADKIVVMDKGKIIETGTHCELIEKNGRYAKLYRMQLKGI